MTRIKIHISNVKLPFYPPCEVKCGLQNRVSTGKTSVLSSVSSVGLGISGFEEENPSSDQPKSVFGGRPSPASDRPIFRLARAVWTGGSVSEF